VTEVKKLVLIVEDEHELNAIVAEILDRGGYGVLRAHDGEEGLRLYRQNRARIALVLTDLKMPCLSGFEFIRAARKHFGFVPFVMLSAFDDAGKFGEAVRLGAIDYVVKPNVLATLLTDMPRWLSAAERGE